jgi:nitrite reductase/ring-hydroxylating ferredoxin subunit
MVGCGLCLLGMPEWLTGCAGTRYLSVPIEGDSLVLLTDSFLMDAALTESTENTEKKYRKYVVVSNEQLEYPICVYRFSETEYKALLMKCTHQGTELQVFGDRLQCPAHASEFSNRGEVQNGPADVALRTFPVSVETGNIKIKLS